MWVCAMVGNHNRPGQALTAARTASDDPQPVTDIDAGRTRKLSLDTGLPGLWTHHLIVAADKKPHQSKLCDRSKDEPGAAHRS